ncbi:hypothetical protein V6Z11_A02G153900 [Gossypium hirsutum]
MNNFCYKNSKEQSKKYILFFVGASYSFFHFRCGTKAKRKRLSLSV